MGIEKLFKLLDEVSTGKFAYKKSIRTENIRDRTIAVDTSLILHKGMVKIRSDRGDDLRSAVNGRPITHIRVLLYKALSYRVNRITPVFVFDGRPPPGIKDDILEERRKLAKTNREHYEEAVRNGDKINEKKYFGRLTRIRKEYIEDCKHLLDRMGMPYIHATGEADPLCAALARRSDVYAAASDDSDLLAFGAPVLLRFMTNKGSFDEVDLKKVRQTLGLEIDYSDLSDIELVELHERFTSDNDIRSHLEKLSHQRFVDLCFLMGIGKVPTITGLGYRGALSLIQKYSNLRSCIAELERRNQMSVKDGGPILYTIPPDYFKKIHLRYQCYNGIEPKIIDPMSVDVKMKPAQIALLKEYLVTELGMPKKEISTVIRKLQNPRQSRYRSFHRHPRREPNHWFKRIHIKSGKHGQKHSNSGRYIKQFKHRRNSDRAG